MARHLVWLRADLRLHDNTALWEACSDSQAEVACVYLITPQQWKIHDTAGVRVDFELRILKKLEKKLAALNIPLLIRETPSYDTVPHTLAKLVKEFSITGLFANRQYEIYEQQRDLASQDMLSSLGCECFYFHDQCAIPPGNVKKPDGTAYSVFTPFKKNWLQQLAVVGCTPKSIPKKRPKSFCTSDEIPDHIAEFTSHVSPEITAAWWNADEDNVLRQLSYFIQNDLDSYKDNRDFPARDGVSKLSPYLAAGVISARQCLNAAFRHQQEFGASPGSDHWIAEIGWRDFYKHVLVAWPHVCRGLAFKRETDAITWRYDKAEFERWCRGETGYPIVDAAMRQLLKTGWMHNRLRMVVAMFLTKDLLIDWRWGEKFFMQHLIDGDLSANNGGWQWSASTGNDAAPYFRIFNPYSQSRKFDPDGAFIREYIPELRDFDGDIHEPFAKDQPSLFSHYPTPMVDHAVARDRVLSAFSTIKNRY